MATITQDPVDRFAFLIEELRRVPRVHGPAGPVLSLILGLFTRMMRLLASLAEQVRTGKLSDTAPPAAPDQARVRPPDLRPRQSGWPVHRIPEAVWGGSTMHRLFEQPEMTEPIAEAPQVGRIWRPPCRMLGVELPPAPAPPERPNDGCRPQRRGPGTLWPDETEFWKFHSKKWV